jgi:hypothetical protein
VTVGWTYDDHAGRDRRVDEDPRSVGAKAIVLAPRVRIRDLIGSADPGRQVQDSIDVAHRVGYRGGIEEVQLLVPGHRDFMARSLREGPQRTAEHAGSPGDQEPKR